MEVSVIMADRPITTTASRLMALPGELRNRIYKAIADDEGPKKIHLHRTHPHESLNSERSLKDRNPGRQYLSLAQTNRMFRSEFMPLYLTLRRPLIEIKDVEYYLDVCPLPDPVLTDSIITVLVKLDYVPLTATLKPVIDLLPLLRADWSMCSFSIFAYRNARRSKDARREFPLLLLESSYHDLALYGGSWEETITTIYFISECRPSYYFHSCHDHDEYYILLRLSAKVNAKASEFEKLRIFHNFVNRAQVGRCPRLEIRCISGRLSMSCVARKAIVADNLGIVKKACKVWSAKSRRYILAAKEETNKAARNASV
ncbi:unnamed protein product [Alternaria sp. RS040]